MKKRIPNISYTVRNGLCTGCGICQNICPRNAVSINVRNGLYQPLINEDLCNNRLSCHRCYDSCPGLGIDILRFSNKLYDSHVSVSYHKLIGKYTALYTGYSKDNNIRFHSASGGTVTQLLIWLIEKKYVSGAVVTKLDSKLHTKAFIATTKEEILSAKSSKYAPVSMDGIIKEIKQREGRYAVVGLPCHIHGFRKYEVSDSSFARKIFGYFGLFCSGTRSFNFTEYLLKERKINVGGIRYLSYRDEGNLGGLVIDGVNSQGDKYHYYEDYQHYCHPLRSTFTPRRCFLCIDHFAELSDISFGDIHVKPYSDDDTGINSIIVRNQKFDKLLHEAVGDGVMEIETLPVNLLLKAQPVATLKKERTATYIKMDKLRGKVVPKYECELKDKQLIRSVLSYIKNGGLMFVGKHRFMWPMIKLLKGKKNVQ